MSHRHVPIFTAVDARYEADCCRPLKEAVDRAELQMHALSRGQYPGRALGRGNLNGLKSVGFWDADSAQSWGLDWHRNEGLEITFCETGCLSFAADAGDYQLTAMDLTITRPWQRHRLGNPNVTAGRLHWVIIDVGVRRPNQPWRWPSWLILADHDVDELTQLLRQNEQVVWPGKELNQSFRDISEALVRTPAKCPLSAIAVGVNQLLLGILQMLRDQQLTSDQTLSESRRAVQLFVDDLATNPGALSREWTIDTMAEACGLHRTQFVSYCRQLTNLSPSRYLLNCRLSFAASRLRSDSRAKVIDIASECGFTSSQYFATKFREFTGCTPVEYQKGAPQRNGRGDA